MHYSLFIYFNNKPPQVSRRLAAHHQEDQLCINSNWYSYALWWLVVGSSRSTQRMTIPIAVYTALILLMMSSKLARNM